HSAVGRAGPAADHDGAQADAAAEPGGERVPPVACPGAHTGPRSGSGPGQGDPGPGARDHPDADPGTDRGAEPVAERLPAVTGPGARDRSDADRGARPADERVPPVAGAGSDPDPGSGAERHA